MRKAALLAMTAVFIMLMMLPLGCNKAELPAEETVAPVENHTIDAFGTVKVKTISELVVDFPARIMEVHVEAGQMLTASQKLVTLDVSDMRNGIEKQQFEIQRLQNELQMQQTRHQKAQQDLERRQALLEAGAIPGTDYEEFEMNVKAAANAIKNVEISISAANSESARLKNKLYGNPHLKGNALVSPFQQGLVYELNCQAGQTTDAARSLLSIMDLQTIYAEAEIPEEFIGDVKMDAAVVMVPVADSSRTYHGRIQKISDMAVERNGETIIPVEIILDDFDQFLKPNYNIDVQIAI
ncbi:MAG: HlyD family efflux transporter periplasmic adaptor subunit [Syntrophomonadaceae bacterium]|nr:HlyD family efflux transporter periplasmic adaptor subunit [Syntrophomonadaceae bacterium]